MALRTGLAAGVPLSEGGVERADVPAPGESAVRRYARSARGFACCDNVVRREGNVGFARSPGGGERGPSAAGLSAGDPWALRTGLAAGVPFREGTAAT